MVHELKSKVAIIGGGPAGCMCAYFLQDKFEVTVFDKDAPLKTLLPTGGGRCNLAHAEYDFRELAKNYPRGEKFLYSVFSKFSTAETIDFFESIGVKTYIQSDLRIFPVSNNSKNVREKFLNSLKKVKFIKEEVLKIDKGFWTVTNARKYKTDYIIISTGGHSSYNIIKQLGHNIIAPKPALTGLETKENFSCLSGVAINGILFTHKGVSGPEIYKISSLRARDNFPYKLIFDLTGELDLQEKLNTSPHKSIKNLLSDFIPKSLSEFILNSLSINPDEKCCMINGTVRDKILDKLRRFQITVTGTAADGEIVTSGGVDLKEINPKTMESKLVPKIYFCGEVVDIDGFCGGFNLQNCWSTAYVAAQAVLDNSF